MSSRRARLTEIVRGFAGRRVVVLGDLVSDEFIYGDIARVSREAPVLILEHQSSVIVPGCGGNSVSNLHALGARPIPVGVIGSDEPGLGLREVFREMGVTVSGMPVLEGFTTPTKTRIMAGGTHTRRQQIVRVDRGGPKGDLKKDTQTRIRRSLDAALKRSEGLLIADYGYGVASPKFLRGTLNKLRRRSFPVTVDSRARILGFTGVTSCTPNQEEVEQALGVELREQPQIVAAGRELLRRTGNRSVLITRGAEGVSVFEPRKQPTHLPAYGSDQVADVTGAGDTVIAVLTLSLIAGANPVEAARIANYAAGLVVAKAGTATVDRHELIQAIEEDCGP